MSRGYSAAVAAAVLCAGPCAAETDQASNALALDIFKQLIEINTADSVGNVTAAAQAMAQRFSAAGFAPADMQLVGPSERKKNLVVRFKGTGADKPVLLIGHLDVVEALRSDWSTDPFKFIEKNGFFYGRGTQDMKSGDAIMVATLIRLKKEGFRPNRDIILALTAGEESGLANGVDWLVRNHRELVDAQFVLNHDVNSIVSEHGKPQYFEMDGTEKVYADYLLTVTNAGGHSSLPVPDNAIYELAAGLMRLSKYEFPFELNNVTRSYYAQMATIETGQRAADMHAILKDPADPQAIARLSRDPTDHSIMHTTCVATRLEGGHANNALPQRAQATVNCRILPGHSPEEVRLDLIKVLADAKIKVQAIGESGQVQERGSDRRGFAPPPLDPTVMKPLEQTVNQMWPGLKVVPAMSTGATDGVFTEAVGIPTFAFSGIAVDRDNDRAHGRDENLGRQSFDQGNEFFYRYLKALTAH